MIFRHEYANGVWIDLENPSEEEVREVARELSISERLQSELLFPTPSPMVASDGNTVFLTLHFPSYGDLDGAIEKQEIDFVVGKNFIITVHYQLVSPLHQLKKQIETEELVAGAAKVTTDVLLEVLFAHFYTSVRDTSNHLADRLVRVETDMFDGHERTTIRLISSISREFLHMEAMLANQEDLIEDFLKSLVQRKLFAASFPERTERILRERSSIARLVGTHRAVATELRETNSALLEARQNQVMKTLTVITFIVMPLELMALIFDMHAPGTPFLEHPNAFWIITGAMLVIGLFLTTLFARKRWFA